MNPTFSVIIPTYNRADKIERAIRSILAQDIPLNEIQLIVVDDGSTDETSAIVRNFLDQGPYDLHTTSIYTRFPENRGRLAARNEGMALAKGEWICWLDSDDEYATNYFSILKEAISRWPDKKIFNFGAVVFDEQNLRSYVRDTFLPELRVDGTGHDVFKSGGIGTGSFVFKRALVEEIGFFPETRTPYGDDRSLPSLAVEKWPAIRDYCNQSGCQTETGQWKPFGNPWGDDWLYFFLLTRNNVSQPLSVHTYIQHVRHA